jgi:hypothetical protein
MSWPDIYFFLYPAGHFGFTAVTFLLSLPLTQTIVVFLSAAALAAASCLAFRSAAAKAAAELKAKQEVELDEVIKFDPQYLKL